MARDMQKKQRKIQKQKAKKKAEKKALARQHSLGLRGELEQASRYPVLHSCEFYSEPHSGLSNVLFSRRIGGGNVAFAVFLIDYYCLGVKAVTAQIVPEGTYNWNIYDKLNDQYERDDLSPADIRNLVESAVEYAHSLGLPPAAEYRKVQTIFGDIDPEESTEEFIFGKDGKPYFTNGPHDSPEKIRRILASLTEHCGDNFHYMIGGGISTINSLGYEIGDSMEGLEYVEEYDDED